MHKLLFLAVIIVLAESISGSSMACPPCLPPCFRDPNIFGCTAGCVCPQPPPRETICPPVGNCGGCRVDADLNGCLYCQCP